MSGRPSMSSAMVWLRSPLATAPMPRATSLVGWTRSPTSVFTELTESAQEPPAPARVARCPIRPSLPTARLTRSNSRAMPSFSSAISFRVSAILPARPVFETGMRTEKSPFRMAVRTMSSCSWSSVSGEAGVRSECDRFAVRPLPGVEACGMVAPAEVRCGWGHLNLSIPAGRYCERHHSRNPHEMSNLWPPFAQCAVWLLRNPPGAPEDLPAECPMAPAPLRILILEDVPMDAELVEYELRRTRIPFDARCVDTRDEF